MPPVRAPRHVRIFLASPGDVAEERQAARDLVQQLEREPLVRRDFTLEVVSWDDPDAPAPMLATLTPQQAVARALPLPSHCDLTVVVLWSRMGTPLEERRPDGRPYLSGTEWEFEEARRAEKPILLYRRTTTPPAPTGDAGEAERQRRSVEQFFAQFEGPGGTLRGGFVTYETVDAFSARLRKDIESILPTLPRTDGPFGDDAGWLGRWEARVQRWPLGRLALTLLLGVLVAVVAGLAVSAFATALQKAPEAPILAHIVRYVLLAVSVGVPLVLLVVSWWWLGRSRPDDGA